MNTAYNNPARLDTRRSLNNNTVRIQALRDVTILMEGIDTVNKCDKDAQAGIQIFQAKCPKSLSAKYISGRSEGKSDCSVPALKLKAFP